jgi:hypothetical protein
MAGEVARSAHGDEPEVYLPGRPGYLVAARLPVSELAYDRAGAASPFGDDLQFPLPVGELTYLHPDLAYDESGDAAIHH